MFENYLIGFHTICRVQCFVAIPFGVLAGMLIGAMPGLSGSIGVALLVPFTYAMDPSASMLLLVGVYCGAEYGGSIAAILVNTPGTPAAAATALDGYACTRKGIPGKALGTSIIASTSGGIISTILLMLLAFPISKIALKFGPAEFFGLAVFGLATIASLSGKFWMKGFIAAFLGLLLRTVGMDSISSFERFTFNIISLLDGIAFIPALIGCFALSEVFFMIEESSPYKQTMEHLSSKLPSWAELKDMIITIISGSFIGTFIGAIPGAGAAIACWISLDQVKRFSKDGSKFGTGILKGVAAPESANNATIGGALVPLLTLGIPGSATTAVLIGAFMIHGLEPGPRLFVEHPDIVYSIFMGLIIANVWMLILGLIGTKLWVRVIEMPKSLLAPLIVLICFIGSYAVNNSMFDVGIMLAFGFVSYVLRKFSFPVAPIILALVLGRIVEANLRRALLQSGGSYMIFIEHRICLVLLILTVFFFFLPFIQEFMLKKRNKDVKAD